MGETVTLTSPRDGFVLDAYRAPAREARRGGLVILHALWGVTPHIRGLADQFAGEGYDMLAPSLLDRWERGFPDADIDPGRLAERSRFAEATGWGGTTWPDVQAAIDVMAPPVFLMGFCFGGTAAWVAACRCRGLQAVSAFYGGHIERYRDETPLCPTILHFGRRDPLIPPGDVDAIEAAHPELPIWLYDAGHAFVAPSDHDADSARLALLRTRQLFHRASGAKESGA